MQVSPTVDAKAVLGLLEGLDNEAMEGQYNILELVSSTQLIGTCNSFCQCNVTLVHQKNTTF